MTAPQKTKKALFWLGLSLPMIALLAMTWLVHQTGGQFNNSFNFVMQTYKVLDLFEQTQARMVEAESNQRGFLLTGRQEYIEPYERAMQAIREDLANLNKLTANDPVQQANLALLKKLVEEQLEFDPVAALASGLISTNVSVVTLTARGKEKLANIRRVMYQAHEEQQQLLVRHQQQAAEDMVASQLMSLILIVAVALTLAMVVLIVLRLEKLQQFVTVCAWTGQVHYQGRWLRLDEYLKRQFGIAVSHGLSEEAADKMKRDIEELNLPENRPPDHSRQP